MLKFLSEHLEIVIFRAGVMIRWSHQIPSVKWGVWWAPSPWQSMGSFELPAYFIFFKIYVPVPVAVPVAVAVAVPIPVTVPIPAIVPDTISVPVPVPFLVSVSVSVYVCCFPFQCRCQSFFLSWFLSTFNSHSSWWSMVLFSVICSLSTLFSLSLSLSFYLPHFQSILMSLSTFLFYFDLLPSSALFSFIP